MSGEMVNVQKSYTVLSRNTPRKFVRLLNKGFKVTNKEKVRKVPRLPYGCNMPLLKCISELTREDSENDFRLAILGSCFTCNGYLYDP